MNFFFLNVRFLHLFQLSRILEDTQWFQREKKINSKAYSKLLVEWIQLKKDTPWCNNVLLKWISEQIYYSYTSSTRTPTEDFILKIKPFSKHETHF